MNTPPKTSKESLARDRARVLVIDDDPLFRNLIVSLLRRNFIVAVAHSGQEGLQKALEHPPDVAVIDYQMPGWDGLETLAAFRKYSSLEKVRKIMLTAEAGREVVIAAIQSGASDYVIKRSFNREEFEAKVERQLRQCYVILPKTAPTLRRSMAPSAEDTPPVAALPISALSTLPDPHSETAPDTALQAMIDSWE